MAVTGGANGPICTPITVGASTNSFTVAAGAGQLLGFSVAETAGSTAAVRVHDGTAAGASNCLTAQVYLTANQWASEWFGPQGIAFSTGIYVERVSGTTEFVFHSTL